ncbi:hypothetical protein FKP32DRAFT_1569415 [Trametes sanguinea]|nr:hypothetical protein FKP32DRAFT_1569415 [Trametes sanguinea]
MSPQLRAFLATLLPLFWCSGVLATLGNTTCASADLDWYTNAVGETPCSTYQRLRQICNMPQETPATTNSVSPSGIPDYHPCSPLIASCCCNSISWALSMLCLK